MDVFLGIDTSCYTTSICLVDDDYKVIADERRILEVPQGGRGLSQSNMVYQHTRNLPMLFEKLAPILHENLTIRAIGVTDKPRRRDDSYMPAFLAGLGYGRSLAAVLGVPLFTISHQENHLVAVLRCLGKIDDKPFHGLHLSGGTTDIVKAVPDAAGLAISRIGGTSDISAGQFIDRVGVAMKLPFPAGVHLDQLAQQCVTPVKGDHVFCRDGEVSFSGPESKAQRQIAAAAFVPDELAQWVLATVWRGLEQLLRSAGTIERLVAAGGVLSNSYLRQQLLDYGRQRHIEIITAPPQFSCDNASGAAFWAAWKSRDR